MTDTPVIRGNRIPYVVKHDFRVTGVLRADSGLDVRSQKIINVSTPTSNNDATNKVYVDASLIAAKAYTDEKIANIDLSVFQLKSEKGATNGYAGLGSDARVPYTQLPTDIATDSELAVVSGVASSAASAASAAQIAADNAQDTADDATTAANNAQTTATTANTTANAAQTTANAAMPKAGGTFTGAVVGTGQNLTGWSYFDVDGKSSSDSMWTSAIGTTSYQALFVKVGGFSAAQVNTLQGNVPHVGAIHGGVYMDGGETFGGTIPGGAEAATIVPVCGIAGTAISAGDRDGIGVYGRGQLVSGGTLVGSPARVSHGAWAANFVTEDGNIATSFPLFIVEANCNMDNSNNIIWGLGISGNGQASSLVFSTAIMVDFLSQGGKLKTFWDSGSGAVGSGDLDSGGKWTFALDTIPGCSTGGIRLSASQFQFWGCDSMPLQFESRNTSGVTKSSQIYNSVAGTLTFQSSIGSVGPAGNHTHNFGVPGANEWATGYANLWSSTSSKVAKRDIKQFNSDNALEVVMNTELYEYKYINDTEDDDADPYGNVGYLAEDVDPLLLISDGHVSAQSTACIALACIQALTRRVMELEQLILQS